MILLRHRTLRQLMRILLVLTPLASGLDAHAQLRLPGLGGYGPLGGLGGLRGFDPQRMTDPAARLLDRTVPGDMAGQRLDQVHALLRTRRDTLQADPRGEPVVRREILAWSPSPAGLAAASAAGLRVLRRETFDALGQTLVVFGTPDGAALEAVLAALRAADPDGVYDYNHVYTGSGAAGAVPDGINDASAVRVGLVDSGVDTAHPAFDGARIERWGCAAPHPDAHGTAVAALLVGRAAPFRGAAPGATLYAADIYCASPTGGSADRIAGALGWLAREQVGVINLSLVGPPNATLERMVAAMVARGHLLVAAVGNDGPAAAPLYPASYPGVVGVSAVDRDGRPLPEAARGPQVRFAAPGSNMVSAAPGAPPWRQVRGTSFAAPIVAALLAHTLARPDRAGAQAALDALAREARLPDNAAPGALGQGVVGAALRTDPSRLR